MVGIYKRSIIDSSLGPYEEIDCPPDVLWSKPDWVEEPVYSR